MVGFSDDEDCGVFLYEVFVAFVVLGEEDCFDCCGLVVDGEDGHSFAGGSAVAYDDSSYGGDEACDVCCLLVGDVCELCCGPCIDGVDPWSPCFEGVA